MNKLAPVLLIFLAFTFVASASDVTRFQGPRWTYPGQIRSHLSTTHSSVLVKEGTYNELPNLNLNQLITVHDNLHNVGRSGIVAPAAPAAPAAAEIFEFTTPKQTVKCPHCCEPFSVSVTVSSSPRTVKQPPVKTPVKQPSVKTPVKQPPVKQPSSNCPGGVCPTGNNYNAPRRVLPWRR